MTASLEPRTAAGKRVASWYLYDTDEPEFPAIVVAIEEQAATEARRELLAKVEGLTAERDAIAEDEQAGVETDAAFRAALTDALDALDGAMDDTHPEGHGCDMCRAADEIRRLIEGEPE